MIPSEHSAALHLASVAFVNARPLVHGLDADRSVRLSFHVPSKLLTLLRDRLADVALLPVIDYPALDGARIIPSGAIGCDGPTLTVRLFSHVPMEQVRVVACDPDSHTSVALARILFHRQCRSSPTFVDLRQASNAADEARLLIGDKVVCEEPLGFEHELDLGAAWKQLTGLPFVFAVWVVRAGVEIGDLAVKLQRARESGLRDVQRIIDKYAVPRGWPAGIALQYLTHYLKFDVAADQVRAIELFLNYAAEQSIIPATRKLELVESPASRATLWEND